MKKLLAFTVFFISSVASAGEYQGAVGMGHQYGGVVGYQASYRKGLTKYYGSLGLVGAAVGFQRATRDDSKHSFGMALGREELRGEDGFLFLIYNYHLSGFSSKGLVFGGGAGVSRQDEGGWFASRGETRSTAMITVDVGYKF